MKEYEFIIAFHNGKSYDEHHNRLADFEDEVNENRHNCYCFMQVIEWTEKDGKRMRDELFFKRAGSFNPEIDKLSEICRDRRTTTKMMKGLTRT